MTYGELKAIKTTGWTTNHVIDDAVNNARWAFGKGFEKEIVSRHDIEKIKEWAEKEGCWNNLLIAQLAFFGGACVPEDHYCTKGNGPHCLREDA